MTTVLVRCAGPMQSWGSRSRFQERDTEREPTKSGIIGLVCAAMGRDRDEPLDDLVALRMGVRVDREGVVAVDFHTAQGVAMAEGGKDNLLSRRVYLADAVFLVGLEGDEGILGKIQLALQNPVWPIFLGRKAFVPSIPPHLPDGIRQEPLESALRAYPLSADSPASEACRVRAVLECAAHEDGEVRRDVPLSFRIHDRRYATRRVRTTWFEMNERGQPTCT